MAPLVMSSDSPMSVGKMMEVRAKVPPSTDWIVWPYM